MYIRPNDLRVYSNLQNCDIIAKAIERYKSIFFPPTFNMSQPMSDTWNILQNLTLKVVDNVQCEQYIELDSNEACKLKRKTI